MQYCRAMGKLDSGANAMFFITGSATIDNVRNCTFVGSGANYNPMETAGAYSGPVKLFNCILTSQNLGSIMADNSGANPTTRVTEFTNCGIPTDAYSAESLLTTGPIRNRIVGQETNLPTTTNIVAASPHYVKVLADYDWTEAAVSVDGSNTNAGNPDVLRPSNAVYKNASSNGTDLVGGAGGTVYTASVGDWSVF